MPSPDGRKIFVHKIAKITKIWDPENGSSVVDHDQVCAACFFPVSSVGAAYMASTYTQIYIHSVFAVQGRQNPIRREYNDELQKYMTGIVSAQGQKLLAINNDTFSKP